MMQANKQTVASELARYLSAAVVIRAVNDGASVGLALLALSVRPGVAGALVAALVAPHLLGPWLSRLLSWTDSRYVLAGSFVLYGASVAAAAVVMDRAPAVVTVSLVLLAGCAGPMLAGGLTSRLPGGETARPRAFDSATWGIATAMGPGLAAVTNLMVGPVAAVLLMAVGAMAAAGLVLTLPPEPEAPERPAGIWDSLTHAVDTRPLRNTLVAVGLTGLGLGALPVAAPLLSAELGEQPGSGGLLIAIYGVTSLVGSLISATRPAARQPLRWAAGSLAVMAAAVGIAATAASYGVALIGFAVLGLANGVYLPTVLAVCRLHAPANGHAQVLVLSSSIKIGGAALAGIWSGLVAPAGGGTVVAVVSCVLFAAAVTPLVRFGGEDRDGGGKVTRARRVPCRRRRSPWPP
ncbi:MFS transporter [Kribbella sp. NPDC023972]|uniref:MFS transporter n=1 Tax=Kribbella sp. NPDC023972 TaxID=3154795 RepID=UPI0033C43F20